MMRAGDGSLTIRYANNISGGIVRRELVIKGKSLTGTSDLTLLAPIIPGLVASLDSMTYKSRVKRLLRTLQGGRASMHEYAAYRPLSDSVERVAVIHSFRVVVLEPENKVLLAVTFDGTWESYIRVLWQKVGTLLDIIFCNTEGYVLSTGSFEEWTAWVSKVQVETSFFYNTHGLTVDDVAYVREEERIHRLPGDASTQDLQATRHHVETAEFIAWAASTHADSLGALDTIRQGLQSLAVLFRVTDMYLPGTSDGDVLWRAARDLLVEFMPIANDPDLPPMIAAGMRARFGRQLDWLNGAPAPARPLPALPDSVDRTAFGNVQAGILWPYEDMTHGCLVLLAVDDPAGATGLLDDLVAWTTAEGQPQQPRLVVNVAVTYEGLRACGLTEDQLALFPQEFREGMEARASMLGDFRANHPRRWRLPVPNWNVPGGAAAAPIELSAVHLVVQMRTGSTSTEIDPTKPDHPLYQDILRIANAPGSSTPRAGIRVLAVEGMRRLINGQGQATEHFGFVDGESDPVYAKSDEGGTYRNRVHVGEFVLGRDNEVDAAVPPATPRDRERREWLADGSFLVIRKLSQHVDRLHNVLTGACAETGLERDVLLAKMMGRRQDGTHLEAPGANINDFNYAKDTDGAKCPFHAHIRRANPRTPDPDQVTDGPTVPQGGRHPRLLRRGMSYGPPYTAPADATAPATPDGEQRGLVFMAYSASISEQFEVIQRWISGGNSSGGHSRQTDPFLGVPDWNEQRTYRFEDGGKVHRIALGCVPAVSRQPTPLVQLEWGMYLFTPSIAVLRKLRAVAAHASPLRPPWSVDDGEAAVERLLEIEQAHGADAAIEGWKALLEDIEAQEKFRSAGAWAAIRSRHGGVLRTAYGVIVADPLLVTQVLGNTQGHYSVAGYRERMLGSIGEIFLGLDAGTEYERQSGVANEAVSAIEEQAAFELALQYTGQALRAFIAAEVTVAKVIGLPRWELNLDAKEVVDKVLARLCQQWFGLPDDPAGKIIVPGSWRWDWKDGEPPIYPAHFTAPSRYIFQPNPGAEVEDYGRRIGAALTAALERFIAPHRAAGTVPQTPGPGATDAPLAKAILGAFPGSEFDALTARSICGVLMGFLPTVDGNFRLTLNELLRDGSFWSLRAAWSAQQGGSPHDKAKQLLTGPMVRAMQYRPSPELVWRTATRDGLRLGTVDVKAGDKIVVAIVSAAHAGLEAATDDVSVVFGGARKPPPAAHPTHACPGYNAGMGVLLGMLAGFVNVAETMRPSPVPLAFTFEGPTPVATTGASE
jgi:Dyp-type peroxidase family